MPISLSLCTTRDDNRTTLYSAFDRFRICSSFNHIIEITTKSKASA
jgi:hypothetical protein